MPDAAEDKGQPRYWDRVVTRTLFDARRDARLGRRSVDAAVVLGIAGAVAPEGHALNTAEYERAAVEAVEQHARAYPNGELARALGRVRRATHLRSSARLVSHRREARRHSPPRGGSRPRARRSAASGADPPSDDPDPAPARSRHGRGAP